jgi:ABC-type nitrate/sulfonate/bicarbonate transport system substrate-binding protein
MAAAKLRVNTYPTAKSLPLHAGITQGIFAKHGLEVELHFTENSLKQRVGLACGDYEIMHLAVDKAVAMIATAGQDAVIVMGGDSGMNEFFVRPEISAFADLRGLALVVDAPDTAYALQARKILSNCGMRAGIDYRINPVGRGALRLEAMVADPANAAAVLNLPYSIQAEELGFHSLGRTTDLLGPYQASGALVMRPWAMSHGSLLSSYIAAYVESLRLVQSDSSREVCLSLLMEKLKLPRHVALRTLQLLVDPAFGFAPDARFDPLGFANTLSLRAEVEGTGGLPADPQACVDLRWYESALRAMPAR